MKTLIALLLSFLTVLVPLWNLGSILYTSAELSVNVYQPIQTAAKLQSPSDMVEYFEQASDYMSENHIDSGNTCLVFPSQPNCDLNLFYRKINQDIDILNEIKDDPIASIETTNALSRIHQSLFSNEDDSLLTPDHQFQYRWKEFNKPVAKLFDWFSGIFAIIIVTILFTFIED